MSDPPIQFDVLLQRCMGNLDFAERLLSKFANRLPQDVEELREAIQQGVPGEVARIAHRLKGSSASVAAERMRQAAESLEQAGRGGELAEPNAWLARLDQEVADVMEAVTHRQGASGP